MTLAFADTNIAVYALDVDTQKRQKALAILKASPIISTQVVNEFLSVTMRKKVLTRPDANHLARILMRRCEVVPVSKETVERAIELGERHQISHWDSLIIASALLANCETLYTEDLHDGQIFDDQLKVVNPFKI